MSISVACTSCKKSYTVADEMAGKKVKCKACGEAFRIPTSYDPPRVAAPVPPARAAASAKVGSPAKADRPAPGAAPGRATTPARPAKAPAPQSVDELPDLNALAAMEIEAAPVAPPPTRSGSFGLHREARPVLSQAVCDPVGPVLISLLPRLLIGAGWGIPALIEAYGMYASPPASLWRTLLIYLVGFAASYKIVEFTAGLGVAWGAQILDVQLTGPLKPRVMGAFALCPLLGMVLAYLSFKANPFRNTLPAHVFGMVLGIAVGIGLLVLLFRIKFVPAMLSGLLGGIGYFLGIASVYGALLGAIYVVNGNLTKSRGELAKEQQINDQNDDFRKAMADGYDRAKQEYASEHQISASDVTPEMLAADVEAKMQARDARDNFMLHVVIAMDKYRQGHNRRFAPDLATLVSDGFLPESGLHSPFGPAPSGPDVVYRYVPELDPFNPSLRDMGNIIVAYDAAQLASADKRVGIIDGNGNANSMPKADFTARLAANDSAVADLIQRVADLKREDEQRRQKQIDDANAAKRELAERLAAIADRQPSRPRAITPQLPVSPSATPPVVPANAWTALPDPVATPPKIRPTLRQIFPKHGQDILYPTQPSNYVCVGDEFEGKDTAATDVHEAWNLQTVARTGHITGQLALKDPVISPDGQFLAGRVTGGQGQATTFEIWSFKTGARVQSLADAPMAQAALPIPIGFLGNDQLLTLDDGLRIWGIKAGTLTRKIDFDVKRGSADLVAVSATGKLVAVLDSDQMLTLLDPVQGTSLGGTPIPASASRPHFSRNRGSGIAFSPDGNELALLLDSIERRILVWSVARGNIISDFTLSAGAGAAGFNRKASAFSWLPAGDGWLVQGSQIVDRGSGLVLYEVPDHREDNAQEYGPRRVLDGSRILMSFKSYNRAMGMETFPLPADIIAKARGAAHPISPP